MSLKVPFKRCSINNGLKTMSKYKFRIIFLLIAVLPLLLTLLTLFFNTFIFNDESSNLVLGVLALYLIAPYLLVAEALSLLFYAIFQFFPLQIDGDNTLRVIIFGIITGSIVILTIMFTIGLLLDKLIERRHKNF